MLKSATWLDALAKRMSLLKDLSIDEMLGAFGCFQAHRGLPVGFLLLQYSVLCTVESLSLLYLFLYLDLYVFGDDALIS